MDKVRLAVIGLGGMGKNHANNINTLDNTELTALCDQNAEVVEETAREFGCEAFKDADELYASGLIDGVVVAVPHYAHTPLTIKAFEAGVHVLCEKPIAVHKLDAQKMIEAREKRPDLKFAAMFNRRTEPCFIKLKSLLDQGELGEITRVNWIVTDWFRTQAYYDSGSWRATWKGEGGGVLVNQCPHQLDLFQWLFGMPERIRGFCSFGKYHHIEVEDDVTAYCEYANGATGLFVTSTGETPGTNRLEIVGDRGKVVVENKAINFDRTETSIKAFCSGTAKKFASIDTWKINVPYKGEPGHHRAIIENFANAIANGDELIAAGEEGVNSVEIANAILLSSMKEQTVQLPLDGGEFKAMLDKLIEESTFVKNTGTNVEQTDITKSFNR